MKTKTLVCSAGKCSINRKVVAKKERCFRLFRMSALNSFRAFSKRMRKINNELAFVRLKINILTNILKWRESVLHFVTSALNFSDYCQRASRFTLEQEITVEPRRKLLKRDCFEIGPFSNAFSNQAKLHRFRRNIFDYFSLRLLRHFSLCLCRTESVRDPSNFSLPRFSCASSELGRGKTICSCFDFALAYCRSDL